MDGHLTGDACVEALLRAGFRIRNRGNGLAILVRGTKMVMIPDVGIIEGDLLGAILRSAGLTRADLEAHLEQHPKRSGFFARPTVQDRATRDEANAPPSRSKTRS